MTLKGCNCLDTFNKQDLTTIIKEIILIRDRQIDFVRTKAPATKEEKDFVITDIKKEINNLNNLKMEIDNTPEC